MKYVCLLLAAACGAGAGVTQQPTTPPPAVEPQPPTTAAPPAPQDPPRIERSGNGSVQEREMVCRAADAETRRLYEDGYDAGRRHDWGAAQAAYEAAVARDPNFCDALDNLGLIYRRAGRIDDAIALYRRAIKIQPSDFAGHMNLGVALRLQKKFDEALLEYQTLVKLDPKDPEGWFGVGQLYILTDHPDDAVAPLEKAIDLYDRSASALTDDARLLLGLAHFKTRRFREARDLFETAYPHYTEDAGLNLYLGETYLARDVRDTAKARRYLEKARDLGIQVPAADWAQLDAP